MKRRRKRVSLEGRALPIRREHRDPEVWLELEEVIHAQPAQKAPVRRAAAERNVLAVVDPVAVPLHREGRPSEPRPRFEERDRRAGIGALDRRGQPGQPSADNGDPAAAHAKLPIRLRVSTQPFSQPRSDGRACRTSDGSTAIRSRIR